MAKSTNSKVLSFADDTLTFLRPDDYSFEFLPNGKVKILADGGHATLLSANEFAGLDTFNLTQGSSLSIDAGLLAGRDIDGSGPLNITGVSFTGADAATDFKFEPNVALDSVIADLIAERGVRETIDTLTVNGSKADAFRLVWDHLDDNYTYYNTAVNDAFIDLGIEYGQYLLSGGAALTETTVKFQPDSPSDLDTAPERSQSLHDNLLGNLHELSIADKFGPAAADIFERIEEAGLGALVGEIGNYTDGRPYYGGNDSENPALTIAFDNGFFFA